MIPNGRISPIRRSEPSGCLNVLRERLKVKGSLTGAALQDRPFLSTFLAYHINAFCVDVGKSTHLFPVACLGSVPTGDNKIHKRLYGFHTAG